MELVKNQRIKELVAELKKRHIIRNQSHFAEIVGSDRATISEIINEHIAVPNKLFGNILDKFPSVNPDWLNDGEGPMFRVTGETTQGDTFNIAGDYTNLGNQTVTIVSPEVLRGIYSNAPSMIFARVRRNKSPTRQPTQH